MFKIQLMYYDGNRIHCVDVSEDISDYSVAMCRIRNFEKLNPGYQFAPIFMPGREAYASRSFMNAFEGCTK